MLFLGGGVICASCVTLISGNVYNHILSFGRCLLERFLILGRAELFLVLQRSYVDAAQLDTSQLLHLRHVKAHACTQECFFIRSQRTNTV